MSKFDQKVNGNTVSSLEYNNIVNPLSNLITSTGQTIDTSNTQVVKAVADYAAVGTFYTDSGTANSYVLSAIGNRLAPNAYSEGMEIRFRSTNANTGASTVNVAGLGVKNIKQGDGSTDIAAGDISPNFDTRARYDGTVFRLSNLSDVGNLTVNGKFNTTPTTATISNGSISYTSGYIRLDTEGGASIDELDTITGGVVGDRVVLSLTDINRDILIKDGTGNIQLFDNRDVLLDWLVDSIELIYDGTSWIGINRIDSDFTAANLTNGYQFLPTGFIIQYGVVGVVGNATVTVTLPVTYTYNNRGAYASLDSLADLSEPAQAIVLNTSQIQVRNSNTSTNSVRWWTIGF